VLPLKNLSSDPQQDYFADGTTEALINEEGMIEVGRGQFSIEPFLYTDGKLVTWSDATTTLDLPAPMLSAP